MVSIRVLGASLLLALVANASVMNSYSTAGRITARVPQGDEPGDEIPGTCRPYTVVPGDTCSAIAQRFGIPLERLIKDNGKGRDCAIQAGETLRICA